MTEKELMGLRFIRKQIDRLEERIAELEQDDGLGAVNVDGMPHGSTPGNPVERMAIARASLHESLLQWKASLIEKEHRIWEFIKSVDDPELQLIIELRFIKLMDWYNIGSEIEEIRGRYVDRTTPAKKLRKFLVESEKSC